MTWLTQLAAKPAEQLRTSLDYNSADYGVFKPPIRSLDVVKFSFPRLGFSKPSLVRRMSTRLAALLEDPFQMMARVKPLQAGVA